MSNQEKLLERSKRYEQDLSEQLSEYSGKAEKFGKNALMIAGGIFLAYQAVKLITGAGKKSQKSKVYKEVNEDDSEYEESPRIVIRREESSSSGIMTLLKAEVGAILVSIARDKILEFLSQLEKRKSNDREEEA